MRSTFVDQLQGWGIYKSVVARKRDKEGNRKEVVEGTRQDTLTNHRRDVTSRERVERQGRRRSARRGRKEKGLLWRRGGRRIRVSVMSEGHV